MPIRQIFARLSKEKNGVVYEEVRRTFREMESGMTQTEALERFGKRTRLPQYKKCAALLAQNIRRGTGELITALGQESENAFEEQKAAAAEKSRGSTDKIVISDAADAECGDDSDSGTGVALLRRTVTGPGKRCIERAVRNDK